MSRYLFNFIGEDGKTFSDSLPQDEYREPDIIQRLKERPAPRPDDSDRSIEEMAGQVENHRKMRYRLPEMNSWNPDRVIYVHPAITEERALEIIKAW